MRVEVKPCLSLGRGVASCKWASAEPQDDFEVVCNHPDVKHRSSMFGTYALSTRTGTGPRAADGECGPDGKLWDGIVRVKE